MAENSNVENPIEPHHPDVAGGPIRAAIFGVSDGLVSNVSLVLGVAGASTAPGVVRLAGLAGLVAGAFSMAAGEYISMKAQTELLEHELWREKIELSRRPELERQELVAIYMQRGVTRETAELVAAELMASPEQALETHAREELGVDPNALGSPVGAAASSFGAFAIGAIVPLFPWFFTGGDTAVAISVAASALVAVVVGWVLGVFTGRSPFLSALRQLTISAAAAGVTFAVGSAVGMGATG